MSIEISEEIRRNFHLFWDNYPSPVMLVRKDRTILELNKAAATAGYPTGLRCCDLGDKDAHKCCQANHALREQTGKRWVGYLEQTGQVVDSYWIPLEGSEELFVHFASDITEWAAGRLFPKKCDSKAGCGCSGE